MELITAPAVDRLTFILCCCWKLDAEGKVSIHILRSIVGVWTLNHEITINVKTTNLSVGYFFVCHIKFGMGHYLLDLDQASHQKCPLKISWHPYKKTSDSLYSELNYNKNKLFSMDETKS